MSYSKQSLSIWEMSDSIWFMATSHSLKYKTTAELKWMAETDIGKVLV